MDPYIRALIENDGLEEVLAEELEWTASQGEELMDSDDELDLLAALRRADQHGGNQPFAVNMERIGPIQRWRDGVVVQHAVRSRLIQLRPPNGELQGEAITEATIQGLNEYVRDPRNELGRIEDLSMSMAVHHSTGTHTWTSTRPIPLEEWLNRSEYTEHWLDKLAKQLNSAESFDASFGEFYIELLFFKNRQRGSEHRGKKGNPGSMSYEDMLKKKKCLITIKNKDDLCASRGLVTMQALADGDPQYKNIRLGRGQQGYLAHKLCQEAGVTEGPCGAEEMQQFQDHLGPQGYQIIVFEGQRGMIWFKDRAYNDASKKICLLKVQNHFHGLRSIPALLNRIYYCHHCEKGYNQETSENHNCLGQNGSSCKRTNGSCPNFATYVTPEVYCDQCNQKFYGQNCYDAHKRGANSVCSRFKKCHECCQVYKFRPKKKHHCYHALCRNCKEVTHVNHRCFIQPLVDEDKTAWGPRMVSEHADEERMKRQRMKETVKEKKKWNP